MKIFQKIFGKKKTAPEQAVIVHFQYGKQDIQPVFNLGDALDKVIKSADVGEYDGNEITADGSDGLLFMYGPDADRLYEVVLPVLKSAAFMKNAAVRIRYGPPKDGVAEKVVKIEG